jgi:hypothetical protein
MCAHTTRSWGTTACNVRGEEFLNYNYSDRLYIILMAQSRTLVLLRTRAPGNLPDSKGVRRGQSIPGCISLQEVLGPRRNRSRRQGPDLTSVLGITSGRHCSHNSAADSQTDCTAKQDWVRRISSLGYRAHSQVPASSATCRIHLSIGSGCENCLRY